MPREYNLMAPAASFLRKEVFPDSRSFWTWAERFGSTGTGGGGIPSLWTEIRERWRVFKACNSVAILGSEKLDVRVFELPSYVRGSCSKVSRSMVVVVVPLTQLKVLRVRLLVIFLWKHGQIA